jgi:hypothetical protein
MEIRHVIRMPLFRLVLNFRLSALARATAGALRMTRTSRAPGFPPVTGTADETGVNLYHDGKRRAAELEREPQPQTRADRRPQPPFPGFKTRNMHTYGERRPLRAPQVRRPRREKRRNPFEFHGTRRKPRHQQANSAAFDPQ